jgi:hypothetical protein
LNLLVDEEYESKQTRKLVYAAFAQLDKEAAKAVQAEKSALETIDRFRGVNNARIEAQQEAERVREELRLYKLQLVNAQKEIGRAQDILREVEAQRDAAQLRANDAVRNARRLHGEKMINLAREEGRRMGFEEGLRRGRELGWDDGRDVAYDNVPRDMRRIADRAVDRITEEEEEDLAEDEELEQTMQEPLPSHPSDTILRTDTPRIEPNYADRAVLVPPQRLRQRIGRSLSDRRPISPPIVIQNLQAPNAHIDIEVPPDNWIPTKDSENGFLAMPPPHEMQQRPRSASPRRRSGSFSSLGGDPFVSDRDREHDLPPPPPRSDDGGRTNHRLRTNSAGSGSTSMSRLGRDLTVLSDNEVGGGPQRPRNLSVIPEGSSRHGSPRGSYARSLRSDRSAESPVRYDDDNEGGSGGPGERPLGVDRQKVADELRYSDPSEPQARRQQAAEGVSILHGFSLCL